jgi:hypothetical protein
MDIQITIALLVLLTAAMVLLRIFWLRVPSPLRFLLIRAALVVIIVHLFFTVTKWGTTSTHFNAIINWLAIAGYELLVLLFSRLSPKWLTSLSAAILIIPLFSSSILFPLALVLHLDSIPRVPLGNHLYYKIVPWSINGPSNSGVDLNIYYTARFAPFLSRKVGTQAFNTDECNAPKAFAVPGPEPKTILASCPHSASQPAGTDDKIVRIR